MMQIFQKRKNRLWFAFEPILADEIKDRAKSKDKDFVLSGKWKKFIRHQRQLKIFEVDGKWVRDNLCVYFGHAGHGLVHEFIPIDEVWISSHHYHEGDSEISNCNCQTKEKRQRISKNFFESTCLHEIVEFEEMKKGLPFRKAHRIAIRKEKELGLLKNSYWDM